MPGLSEGKTCRVCCRVCFSSGSPRLGLANLFPVPALPYLAIAMASSLDIESATMKPLCFGLPASAYFVENIGLNGVSNGKNGS